MGTYFTPLTQLKHLLLPQEADEEIIQLELKTAPRCRPTKTYTASKERTVKNANTAGPELLKCLIFKSSFNYAITNCLLMHRLTGFFYNKQFGGRLQEFKFFP